MHVGEFSQAEQTLSQVDALCRQKPSETSVAAAAWYHLAAIAWLNRSKDFAQALAAAHQSEGVWKTELNKLGLDERHPWRAASLNNLAAIDLLCGDYVGAKELFEGASDAWSQSLGEKDPHIAVAKENLAVLRCVLGQQDKGEQAMAEATAILGDYLPKEKDHPLRIPHWTTASMLAQMGCDSTRRNATRRRR